MYQVFTLFDLLRKKKLTRAFRQIIPLHLSARMMLRNKLFSLFVLIHFLKERRLKTWHYSKVGYLS